MKQFKHLHDVVTAFGLKVKSGNFGHQVNSDIIRLQTVEIQMMSRLIRIFTVCLVNLIFHESKQGRCPNLPDVRRYLALP